MRRLPESSVEKVRSFFRLPHLDAMTCVTLQGGIQADFYGAERGNPANCVFARACRRANLDPLVFNTRTWVISIATAELLTFNQRRGVDVRGIAPGDQIVLRYENDRSLEVQVRLFDTEGREFVPGPFSLLPPRDRLKRDKASATRPDRADARREGRVPTQRRRPAQLTRVALARASLTHEVAI